MLIPFQLTSQTVTDLGMDLLGLKLADLNTGRYLLAWEWYNYCCFRFWWMMEDLLITLTESWNGSSWTEVNDLNTARASGSGFGTKYSIFSVTGGGVPGANKALTEDWNGASWSETGDLPAGFSKWSTLWNN